MKKLAFLLASAAFIMLSALPANATSSQSTFLRWKVYTGAEYSPDSLFQSIEKHNKLLMEKNEAITIYGGLDTKGVIRFLEIYPNADVCKTSDADSTIQKSLMQLQNFSTNIHTLDAHPFLLASKQSGTADRVRMARLVIDPNHLEEYKKYLAEEIKNSVANEPGVLALLATTETTHPNIFHLLELYRDEHAYNEHIAGKYFQKYNLATQGMITEKSLIVNIPHAVEIKANNLQ